MDACAFRNQLLEFRRHPAQKTYRSLARSILRFIRKDPSQVVVEICRPLERVLFALAIVMLAQSDTNLVKRLDLFSHAVARTRAGDFAQKLIDVIKFLQRGPSAIPATPVRTRLQPNSERLSEVFGRVRLGVPSVQI